MAHAPRFLLALLFASHCAVATAGRGTEGSTPITPRDSLKLIRTKPGLEVQLAASEPQIADPVAIDWGADGKMWVCEMHDYPTGVDENFQPGGRVKFLEDADGDGFHEKSTLFLENIPFPTGVTAWGKGVLICAAPDLLYAEDTNGDGKADKIQKVFTGFATDNYQARLNSLAIGLDNWIYGANGLLGGNIRGIATKIGDTNRATSSEVNIRNRDFRIHPLTGAFEAVSGLTQQGRVRDDWGNWFGCNNSEWLLHFPWNERYAARNPSVTLPRASVYLPNYPNSNRCFPISPLHERYNDPDNANRATSVGGLGLYRDTLLGEEYYGNAFVGETVHNLVHREIISGDGVKFTSHRATDEQQSEFLASTDNWFRPVQIRTGPDGALYVVDMYRFLIEHPRWIPAKRLAQINVRAGSDKGRIYRVKSRRPLRPIRDLTKLTVPQLAAALDTPNGTDRDRIHIELFQRRDTSVVPPLDSKLPQVRVQSLSILDGLNALKETQVLAALSDPDPHVRQNALRISESFLGKNPSAILAAKVLSLTNDSSPIVLHQLAYSLGEWNDPLAGSALNSLSRDSDLKLKVLTSAARFPNLFPQPQPAKSLIPTNLPPRIPAQPAANIRAFLDKLANLDSLSRNPKAGAEIFQKACAACHALNGSGVAIGPDLALLRDKDFDYFVKNIVDPNAIVEPRFIAYNIELKDDRSFLAIIQSENAASLSVAIAGGQSFAISKSEIKEIHPSKLSIMPEGLADGFSPADMANLIAYLKTPPPQPARPSVTADTVLRNPPAVAAFVLDDTQPNDLRQNAINSNPQFAAPLIAELTRDLSPNTPEEYRRIPWIWRVAIAAGKRNDSEQILGILQNSLPQENQPLHDWQAVVIGGGIINGISQRNQWPAARILEIIGGHPDLQKRWTRSLALASAMTDNEKTPAGTRYDALRMIACEPFAKHGPQLTRYLNHKNAELQMGAVSGLVDVDDPAATRQLLTALPILTVHNRALAVDGLLRTTPRALALLDELAARRIEADHLSDPQREKLKRNADEPVRARALQLLK